MNILKSTEEESFEFLSLSDINEEYADDFIFFLLKLQSSRPALISDETSELSINSEETKLYRFPIDSSKIEKVQVLVENLKGSIEVDTFFDNSYDEFEEIERDSGDYPKKVKLSYKKTLHPEQRTTFMETLDVINNSTNIIMNVVGIDEISSFKIKIITKKLNVDSFANKIGSTKNTYIFAFILYYLIY